MNAFCHIRCAVRTDVGRKRKNNEDAFGAFPSAGVFCVADGMGGGEDGEIASAATVQSIRQIVPDLTPPADGAFAAERLAEVVAKAVDRASRWIFRRAQNRHLHACGSTIVGICFDASDPKTARAFHAGDSRLYRIRGGESRPITTDHSAANLLGVGNEADMNPMFRSMILRAVGIAQEVALEWTPVDVAADDRFLLCSDGLSHMLPDGRLAEISRSCPDPAEAAESLVAAANEAGGLDNVTVVVLDVGELPVPRPVVEGPRMPAQDEAFFGESCSDEAATGETAERLSEPEETAHLERAGASMPFEQLLFLRLPADYDWSDARIARMGERRDIAAYAGGDFSGMCLIFCHGNGETAVSERRWFEELAKRGVSVVCPDYRGYGLSDGTPSEQGCYEAAHAAYDWLRLEKGVPSSRIAVLGYSLGSAVAVELASTVALSALILQAPFLNGAALKDVWEKRRGLVLSGSVGTFPTDARLPQIRIPTLVIHGTVDEVIPFTQGQTIYRALPVRRKRFVPVRDAGHCTFQYVLGQNYIPLLVDFLRDRESCATRLVRRMCSLGIWMSGLCERVHMKKRRRPEWL